MSTWKIFFILEATRVCLRSTSFMLYLFGLLTVRLIFIVILGWWICMFNAARRPMKENPNSYEGEKNLGSDTPLPFSSSPLSHYVTFNFLYHYLVWISVINPINSDDKFPKFHCLTQFLHIAKKKASSPQIIIHTIASCTRISLNSWNGYFPPHYPMWKGWLSI